MMVGKYFDDLEVGQRFETPSRTITETDVMTWFAAAGDHTENFLNREYARANEFGGPIVPAPFTYCVAMALFNDLGVLQRTSVALLGIQLRALAPIRFDDTIHAVVEVTAKKSTSKPDRGVVTFLGTVINQDGRAMMSFTNHQMMFRRPDLVELEE